MRTHRITQPDDWHVHFRDEERLEHTVSDSAKHFARVLAMPNLKPPLTTIAALTSYRERILQAIPDTRDLDPYLTFYLNESVSGEELEYAADIPWILGGKLYPAGATTHSEQGVKSITALFPLFKIMEEKGLVLQVHGEVTHGDIFEREKLFVNEQLPLITKNFPKLRVILEHISTRAAVEFVEQSGEQVAATVTPQHLIYNRNQLLAGGIRPHFYCLPILKSEHERKAIQQAIISGHPRFFAGTDSAPHAIQDKESSCGCAGIYSAPYALALYCEFLDKAGHLSLLNDFTSRFGAEFYQLPINKKDIELIEKEQQIPLQLPFGNHHVVPIAAGQTIGWSINEN